MDLLSRLRHYSVVVPTYSRSDDVDRLLCSLVSIRYKSWDILVIDQSEDLQTRRVCEAYSERLPNLAYHHLDSKNSAIARNIGIERAQGDIVALIDDDCTVESNWLDSIESVQDRYDTVDLIMATVKSAPHDREQRFIPENIIRRERVLHGRLSLIGAFGMSANFTVRRKSALAINGFDPELGPGAPVFPAAVDMDFLYRILLNGGTVVETPEVTVRHYGGRDYADGSAARLIRQSRRCMGAVDMKLLRCGEPVAALVMAQHIAENLRQFKPLSLLRGRPSGLAWTTTYARGLLASFQLPVDRERLLYKPSTHHSTCSR